MSIKPLTILTNQSNISKITFARVTSLKTSVSDIRNFSIRKKVAKVHSQLSAIRGLQKAESSLWQFFFGMLKLQKLLLIVSQLFADTFADTWYY